MKYEPLLDLILIKPIEFDSIKTDLFLPQNSRDRDRKKFGVLISKGAEVKVPINNGDIIMWLDERGESLIIDSEEHLIMSYKELKARIIETNT